MKPTNENLKNQSTNAAAMARRIRHSQVKMNILNAAMLLLLTGSGAAAQAKGIACEDLANPRVFKPIVPEGAAAATITSATNIAATPDEAAHCRVEGIIDVDAKDPSLIHYALKLPIKWNHRFLYRAGNGFSGVVDFSLDTQPGILDNPVNGLPGDNGAGFAFLAQDSGHVGGNGDLLLALSDASWAKSTPGEEETNYSFLSYHMVAIVGKDITKNHYGRKVFKSYMAAAGSSSREAFMEVTRYPADYDGVLADALWTDQGNSAIFLLAVLQKMFPDPINLVPTISETESVNISNYIINKCDGIDGILDGIIDDPRKCHIDPAKIPGLNQAQIDALKQAYNGFRLNGKKIYPGFLPGGESKWNLWILKSPTPLPDGNPDLIYGFVQGLLRFMVLDDPTAYIQDFALNRRNIALLRNKVKFYEPKIDIKAFAKKGGKLISTAGWDNAAISPLATINTFARMAQLEGGARNLSHTARLYMVPGMGNSEGIHSRFVPHGQGTVVYDSLSALTNWVEKGIAPDSISASSIDGKIQRPLCVYPKVARRINPNLSDPNLQNYVCVLPEKDSSSKCH